MMKTKINMKGLDWLKRFFIEEILEELKANNKTVCDIKYIIKKRNTLKEIEYWLSWEILLNKIKIDIHNEMNFVIIGDSWWVERNYEGQCEDATWNFRTMPKRPKLGYEQYEAYKRTFKKKE